MQLKAEHLLFAMANEYTLTVEAFFLKDFVKMASILHGARCISFAIVIIAGSMMTINSSISAERVEGTTKGKGVTCYRVTTVDNETISITGNVVELKEAGLQVVLSGHWQEVSTCQQGRTFYVETYSIN